MKKGTVVDKQGEYYIVYIPRESACGDNCASCRGCAQSGGINIKAKSDIEVNIHDKVNVKMNEDIPLLLIFLVFMLPVILLIAFYFLFTMVLSAGLSALLAVLIDCFYFLALKIYDKKYSAKKRFDGVIINRID